jgi:hypothetical protein
MNRLTSGLLCALATWLSLPADALTDAPQQAYEPYRTALFRTNGKVQIGAQQAVMQAQRARRAFVQQVGAKPPVPYAHEAGFTHTVQQVTALYETAAAEVHTNQLPAAHDTLEGVSDTLAYLR